MIKRVSKMYVQAVYDYIAHNPLTTSRDIVTHYQTAYNTVMIAMRFLVRKGYVIRVGGGVYVKYRISNKLNLSVADIPDKVIRVESATDTFSPDEPDNLVSE